jgi:oligoribonuclease NrnB/cAMP/cGMP phosphodiesterase (DHH superfamily)
LYGTTLSDLPAGKLSIIMLDVSFPKDIMGMVAADHNLVVLDHHKTAQENLAGADYALFDMNKSGAKLAQEYFNPILEQGQWDLADYLQDRDLWQWKLNGSREFSAALQSYDFDFDVWGKLSVLDLVKEGCAITRLIQQQVQRIIARTYKCDYNGTPGMIVNSPILQSETGEALLAKYPDIKFASIFYENEVREQVFSLRSRSIDGKPELDVSVIAKEMGGGGHPNAAGFKVSPKVEEDVVSEPAAPAAVAT